MTDPTLPDRKSSIERPRPLGSLVASAKRLTSQTITRQGSNAKAWQEDAWEMFDLVGEQRFLSVTLAGRMSQARLYVGLTPEPNSTDDPEPTDNPDAIAVLDAVGSTASARAQLINRLGINLFVSGDGWLAGIPRELFPPSLLPIPVTPPKEPVLVGLPQPAPDLNTIAIDELEWRMLSVTEVSSNAGGEVTLKLGEGETDKIVCSPDDIYLVRVWRPHPRRWWEADSPTRSSLPVLRELVGLTMHISAQVDSRLAGAGLLIVPQSAQRSLRQAAGVPDDDESDQFTEALMEAMLKPIQDRANASALVPLVVTVPDESTALFNFITFAKPLDTEARNLRDEAIRRLALGQDAPPELLLGTGGMNHWGAWLVQQDVVATHLEPPLALICDALTTQYLWPVLVQQGMDESEARKYVVWYDVSHLVVRPNQSQDAMVLHDRGVISDTALRQSTGFDETDTPPAYASLEPDVVLALQLAGAHPILFQNPGLPQLVAQIRAAGANNIPDVVVLEPTGGNQVHPTQPPPPEVGAPGAPQTETKPAVVPPPGQGQAAAAETDPLNWHPDDDWPPRIREAQLHPGEAVAGAPILQPR